MRRIGVVPLAVLVDLVSHCLDTPVFGVDALCRHCPSGRCRNAPQALRPARRKGPDARSSHAHTRGMRISSSVTGAFQSRGRFILHRPDTRDRAKSKFLAEERGCIGTNRPGFCKPEAAIPCGAARDRRGGGFPGRGDFWISTQFLARRRVIARPRIPIQKDRSYQSF